MYLSKKIKNNTDSLRVLVNKNLESGKDDNFFIVINL